MNEHDVLVVGGGPVGLMTAAELASAGVDVAVLERRTTPDLTIKAGAVTGGAVQALDHRGLLEAAQEAQARAMAQIVDGPAAAVLRARSGPRRAGHIAAIGLRLDLIETPAEHGPIPFMLVIAQHELETILRDRVEALGVPVHRGVTVRDVAQDGSGVIVRAREAWSARWLVGADGGRSAVRTMSGIGFPGTDPEITGRQALVGLADADDLEPGWNHTPTGVYCHGPMPGRVLTVEFDGPPADRDAPVTAEEVQASLRRVSGVDVRVTALHSATRWTDNARVAATYRQGRVLLAGDAAHVHPPFGGQGLGLGLGDAMNLGWKLAAVVTGRAPQTLLDTYDPERRPAAEAVLELTRAQVALMRPDPKTRALRRFAERILDTPAGATRAAGLLAGPEIHAPIAVEGDDPLVGRLAPEVVVDDGRRLAELARDGRFTLVGPDHVLAAASGFDVTTARAGEAMLVRPDGVVAWAGEGSPAAALERWCPREARRAAS